GWIGGVSCVLGNPPWERVKLQEKEFFAARHPDISGGATAGAREKMIAALNGSEKAAAHGEHPQWATERPRAPAIATPIREPGHYPLTGTGDINTYAVFAEAANSILHPAGRLGIIVPTGIATDSTTQYFFRDLIEHQRLDSLLDFVTNPELWTDVGN